MYMRKQWSGWTQFHALVILVLFLLNVHFIHSCNYPFMCTWKAYLIHHLYMQTKPIHPFMWHMQSILISSFLDTYKAHYLYYTCKTYFSHHLCIYKELIISIHIVYFINLHVHVKATSFMCIYMHIYSK